MGVVSGRPARPRPVCRGEVYLIALDPARGQEIRKTRPCVVVSPDELNAHMGTYIVAPLTTGSYAYPFRVGCRFAGKDGHVVLDQLRTVDRERLVQRLGVLTAPTQAKVLGVLQAMFAP
jgi:mRNA interferase MazF